MCHYTTRLRILVSAGPWRRRRPCMSLSFYLSPQYASLINTVPHHDLAPPKEDYIIASARFGPQLAVLLSPGPPRPHDQLRVPLNSGFGRSKCHFIRSGRPRYEQTKWLMCAERIPLIPISVCGYQMAKRSPWLFIPRGEMPCKHTHIHSLTHTLFLSSPPHPLFHVYATSLAHPASRLIPMWSRCSPSYTTPTMFSPLLDGYGHHVVHLRRFYSTEHWCLSAPSRRPPSAGYEASIGEHRQADGLFRPLSPSHVSLLRHA